MDMKTSTFLGLNVLISAIAVIVIMHFGNIHKNTESNLAQNPSHAELYRIGRPQFRFHDAPAGITGPEAKADVPDVETSSVAPETSEVPVIYLAALVPMKPMTDAEADLVAQISALIDQNREEQIEQQRAIAAHSVADQY